MTERAVRNKKADGPEPGGAVRPQSFPGVEGKCALVVGGGSGLGYEIARGFALHGARVILAGRTARKLEKAFHRMKREGLCPLGRVRVDVRSPTDVANALARCRKMAPHPDIVVCTAGVHCRKPAEHVTPALWKKVLDTNLNGTFHVNRVFGKAMLSRGRGVLINIGSLGSRVALSETVAYNVSKSGVEMLTRSLAAEWASRGVRVNVILPGVFRTALNEKALSDPRRAGRILACTPMGRFGECSEIVSAALFLASDASGFVTGASIPVDGGFLASAGF